MADFTAATTEAIQLRTAANQSALVRRLNARKLISSTVQKTQSPK
jgi:hypothetical protein